MARAQKPIEAHLREGTFDRSKHWRRLPAHALAAYDRCRSAAEGRAAALSALEAGEDELGRLHRSAFCTARQELAILYGGAWPMAPERQALWNEVSAARAEYRRVANPYESATIPPPDDPVEAREWERSLWERILNLPDHDPGEFELIGSLEAFASGDSHTLPA